MNPANSESPRFFGSLVIVPGSRVLDVGCGNGDLSRLVARLAGPSGEVVAIDSNQSTLEAACAKSKDPDAAPIHYRAVDLSRDLPELGRFDVIVGRRILMYLPDTSATLSRLVGLAKPGAVLAFQEHARRDVPFDHAALPLHQQLYDWTWDTVAAEGGDVTLGLNLVEKMRVLGLSIIQAYSEFVLIEPDQPSFLPTLMRVMLPRLVERGVSTEGEVQVDTLAQRLASEHQAFGGATAWDQAFFVAGRVVG
ncbi:class I SAM-dependent methyltransferase [Agrobacterium sp. CG674]